MVLNSHLIRASSSVPNILNCVGHGFASKVERCHGLVPWYFTFAATCPIKRNSSMPRPCAVEVHVFITSNKTLGSTRQARGITNFLLVFVLAPNVSHHGTSPWHLRLLGQGRRTPNIGVTLPKSAIDNHQFSKPGCLFPRPNG